MTRPTPESCAQGSFTDLVELVQDSLRRGTMSAESGARFGDLIERFACFARALGVAKIPDVSAAIAELFIRAPARDGSAPAIATMHLRRSAVRLLFAEGRRLGLAQGDPALDVTLPPRSSLRARPLTDDEIELCRAYSVRTSSETRQPAAWALAEATARSAELVLIRVGHIALDRGRVWIPGSSKTDPRFGELTDWGKLQLERHLRASGLGLRPSDKIVCRKAREGASATASASIAIAKTLRRAGLHGEPDVRPASVAAWSGASAYDLGTPIETVARMLGIRSLDRAAAFIGLDWSGGNR
jgi:integrase